MVVNVVVLECIGWYLWWIVLGIVVIIVCGSFDNVCIYGCYLIENWFGVVCVLVGLLFGLIYYVLIGRGVDFCIVVL